MEFYLQLEHLHYLHYLCYNYIYTYNILASYTTYTYTIYTIFFPQVFKRNNSSKILHFFLNRLMLFDLKEIYFSVWYLFNKILSKWL